MKSDFEETGKLYPKLDAYYYARGLSTDGWDPYIASSCQFRTQSKFKKHIAEEFGLSMKEVRITKESMNVFLVIDTQLEKLVASYKYRRGAQKRVNQLNEKIGEERFEVGEF